MAGTTLCYVGFFAIIGGAIALIAPLAGQQADELAEEWPEVRQRIEDGVDDLAERSREDNWIVELPTVQELEDSFGGGDEATTTEFESTVVEAREALNDVGEERIAGDLERTSAAVVDDLPSSNGLDIGEQAGRIREIGGRVLEIVLILVLGPILAFYLLIDLPHLGRVTQDLIPATAKPEVLHVSHRLNHAIGGYFRGQLLVAIIVGAMVSVGLAILGLPFWLLVGAIAGLFNMVPLIGPYVGAVPGIAIAFTSGGGLPTAIWVAVIMIVAQQIDNHLISPVVMHRTTSLHPAAVMLALLAGGTLFGFFGLLVAVPVTATLKILVGHLWRTYVLGQHFDEMAADQHADDAEPAVGFVEDVVERERSGSADRRAEPAVAAASPPASGE